MVESYQFVASEAMVLPQTLVARLPNAFAGAFAAIVAGLNQGMSHMVGPIPNRDKSQ